MTSAAPTQTTGSRITVMIFSIIVLFGSFILKVYSHLGDAAFASVISVLCFVVLVSVFMGPIRSLALSLTGLKAQMFKMEQTEATIKEVANALLEVIETHHNGAFLTADHDQQAAQTAKKKLKKLIT